MGRELRKVPANWEHPKNDEGEYKPMLNEFYGDVLNKWLENHNKWEAGTHPDLIEDPLLKEKYPFYAMWGDNAPDVENYQTKKYSDEELTHIQLYETTSEGTPISPVFKANELEKLCEWASENATFFANIKAPKAEWMELFGHNMAVHQNNIGNS